VEHRTVVFNFYQRYDLVFSRARSLSLHLSSIHQCTHPSLPHYHHPPCSIYLGSGSGRRSHGHWLESQSSGRSAASRGASLTVDPGGYRRRHVSPGKRLRAHVWADWEHQQHDAVPGRETRRRRGGSAGASRCGAAGFRSRGLGRAYFLCFLGFFEELYVNSTVFVALASYVFVLHFFFFDFPGCRSICTNRNQFNRAYAF